MKTTDRFPRLPLAGFAVLAVFMVAGLWLAVPSPAAACSCVGGFGADKPCESYWGTDAVFLGRVTGFEDSDVKAPALSRRFDFEVLEGFAGVQGATAEVWTGRGGGDCGYEFIVGNLYLVLAGSTGGRLHTSICGSTMPAAAAGEMMAYARQVARGTVKTSLYGHVGMARENEFLPPSADDSLEGVTVDFQGPSGQRFAAKTNWRGDFEVEGKPAGRYTLRVELPAGLPAVAPQEVELRAKQCAGVLFEVPVLATLEGRAVGTDDQPLSGVRVDLHEIGDSGEVSGPLDSDVTDEEGRYAFPRRKAGLYMLSIGGQFYPGTKDPEQAERFKLLPSGTFKVNDFRVPR